MPSAAQSASSSNLELLTIYEVSKILGSSLDLEQTLREVLRALSYQLQMHRGRVYLQGEDGALRLVAAQGLPKDSPAQQIDYNEGESISSRILKTGMPAVVPNLAEEPLFNNRSGGRDDLDEQVASLVGVPIKAAGTVIGVLTIDRISDEGPSGHFGADVRFLTMVANLIGQTVRLHRTVAEERRFMMRETFRVQKELRPVVAPVSDVVCTSPNMVDVLAQVHRVAPFKSTALIRGESGTGKELIARAIHNLSPRKDAPFIRVNCAALPESLLESELFGHEKGSFTGAQKDHKGRFELASGGTLFLDEIGDISSNFQAKLLRVLQEQEFERVGGSKTIKTDVRLICATNLNLEEAVGHGKFRADLYFRINVVTIHLPPLRERRGDIAVLARHFITKFGRDNGLNLDIDHDALEVLNRCTWPGNVRELENCIERAATQCRNGTIRVPDLSCSMNLCNSSVLFQYRNMGAAVGGLAPSMSGAPANPAMQRPQPGGPAQGATMPPAVPVPANGAQWPACASGCSAGPSPVCGASKPLPPTAIAPLPAPRPAVSAPPVPSAPSPQPAVASAAPDLPLDEPEAGPLRDRLIWAMERTGWVQAKAARLLGMTTRQVSYALRKYNIEIKRF
ncbi:nif-specific transcriptional activator NifA [Azospirillum picis]|uniref:Nif-specific regulatory protein n=1 Tax=Azospirillum picis TaxID=488438 RepID=A0ABU0MIG0_9PROT|nr:nif-specific transcriptional activator NifA [Azospirillum picis]MBP2299641.1 Nif-specific regulatory protein [Azospirillum picis]MDQ0533232.1 Nif-specific regulatory protein [Azospirillum picis]